MERPLKYAGIGSRETPEDVLELMAILGYWFAKRKYTLRSGGAVGADENFEFGCDRGSGPKEIFYPDDAEPWSFKTVDQYHPAPGNLKPFPGKLMARNVMQILGRYGDDPVNFVVCWTPNASGKGGTGQAIRIANDYNIPVLDLGDSEIYNRAWRFVKKPL